MDFLASANSMEMGSPISFKESLNEEQYAAVTTKSAAALVLAGAGSGKTRTLTYRVAYLLSQGVQPYEILLLTFTNKSAKEMLERVSALTGVPPYHFWGGTFHHIGQKIIRNHTESLGLQKNFNILDQGDAEGLFAEAVRRLDPKFLKNKDYPKAKVLYEIQSFARNTQQSIADALDQKYPYFSWLLDTITPFYELYSTLKKEQNVVDYDDLMDLWLRLFKEDKDARELYQGRFRHILVDEYQDTNPLQAALIDAVNSIQNNIMVVGDDAQCIYTWRGANLENILGFPDRHPGTSIYKIQTNYRSTPEILNLANGALEQHSSGFEKELRPSIPSGPKPYWVPAGDTKQQAFFIIKRIKGLINEGFRASDIAILYRAHFHAMDLQMELSRISIPYQITSGVRFFEQAHIRDLVAQLRFANNPTDSIAFERFTTLLPKVGPKTAQKILLFADSLCKKENISIFQALEHPALIKKVPEPAKEIWLDVIYTLQDIAETLKKQGPAEDSVKIALEGWYIDYLKNLYTNWISRQEDLEGLISFAAKYPDTTEFLAQLSLLSSEISDRGTASSEESIKLTTIHQAKGLEFPIVFIIGLSENLFPLKRALDEGNIDEELRLFYVAATRAQQQLYLIHPKVSYQGGPPALLEPCRFVTRLSPSLYETVFPSGNRY